MAAVRRRLLHDGRAVIGRAVLDGRLWLKATLLNPHARPGDLAALLKLVEPVEPVDTAEAVDTAEPAEPARPAELAEGHTPA